MKTRFIRARIQYSGAELSSHWIRKITGITGSAIAAFAGPCDVKPEHMVDMEDLETGQSIYSEEMLHFIAEHFDCGLDIVLLRQRLFASLAGDLLRSTSRKCASLLRDGDDLYIGRKKMSVSIATVSPVSALFHFGINVSSRNTPVPAAGLGDLGVDVPPFARALMKAYVIELDSVSRARAKSRGVK